MSESFRTRGGEAGRDVNSASYWNRRFETDWDEKGGRSQSREFMLILIQALPIQIVHEIETEKLSLIDAGCAKGDGTAVLMERFPDSSVSGFDFSPRAIEQARATFPGIDFFVQDISDLDRRADIVLSSHCFEHLKGPHSALKRVIGRSNRYVVLLLPFLERHPICAEHRTVVHATTFPERIAGWRISHRSILPPSDAWPGNQLLLIYQPTRRRSDGPPLPVPSTEALDMTRELEAVARTMREVEVLLARGERYFADDALSLAKRRGRLLWVMASGRERLFALAGSLLSASQEAAALRAAYRDGDLVPGSVFRELDEDKQRLEGELAGMTGQFEDQLVAQRLLRRLVGSRSWRFLNVYWRWLHRVRRLVRPVRRRMSPLSWYAYNFRRYELARRLTYERALQSVRPPFEEGLVSIVLPVYNGADYLREALDSCLEQSYERLELIAVNDGSTDDSGEILEEYARRDPRIRIIHQENRKLPQALSRGLSEACGEFLTWTSADNRLKPAFLERMVNCLRRHPYWGMVYANVDIIGSRGEPLRESDWYDGYQDPPGSEHIHLPADPSELNVWPNNYVGAAFLYRSRVAWALGDYSKYRFGTEDYDYWMRVNSLFQLHHADFDDCLYEYRFHQTSLTARDDELSITRSRDSLMAFEDFRRDFFLSPVLWRIDTECDPKAEAFTARLQARLRHAGHILFEEGNFDLDKVARLWTPTVHLHVVSTGAAARPIETPRSHSSALEVVVTAGPPPRRSPSGDRDLYLATTSGGEPPRASMRVRGWVTIPDVSDLFTFLDIRAKSHCLERLEAEIYEPEESGCTASVVVCTYKRLPQLQLVVEAVAGQDFPARDFELVIVDNNPVDKDVRREIERLRRQYFSDRPAGLKLVLCPFAGLSHARNAGISEARGELVCFLDDDAVPEPDWLHHIVQAFRSHPGAGVVGGPIRLDPPDPRPDVLHPGWERYWSQFLPPQEESMVVEGWWELPWGANWSARRRALLEIGGFRSRYGRKGNDFSGGEEIVAARMIQRLGYQVVIAPRAKVRHLVAADRYTWRHVRNTIVAGNVVSYQAQRDLYLPRELSYGTLLRWLLNPKRDSTVSTRTAGARVKHWLYRREAWLRVLKIRIADDLRRHWWACFPRRA